jgi:hypothetical protein
MRLVTRLISTCLAKSLTLLSGGLEVLMLDSMMRRSRGQEVQTIVQNSLASMDFADCTFPAGAESMRKSWDQDIIYCQALDLDSDVLEVGHNET